MKLLYLIFLCFASLCRSQLIIRDQNVQLGTIPEAYELKGDLIVKNASEKKIYLMRADADPGVKIYTSKKTLQIGDTCLLVISFIPATSGNFKKRIHLVASDKETPYELSLSGNLLKAKTDDKTACYYFGSRKTNALAANTQTLIAEPTSQKKDVTNRIPDPSVKVTAETAKPVTAELNPEQPSGELSPLVYKPNNILFLVDVSGSMKDSLKLPLMKSALYTLIDAVREVDYITFVTYADSVKVLVEAAKGSDKKRLHELVSHLSAKGLTKGKTAILYSQQLAQKHYIPEGNNQIFLATDGKFRFYSDDFKIWTDRQGDKKIMLSTVAFGNDRAAMNNLQEIAEKGMGSFIHIKKRNGSQDKLLEEVKLRSKR